MNTDQSKRVAVIGCGYIGESLLRSFSKAYDVTGFDISQDRIKALSSKFTMTSNVENIKSCNVYLVSVPTNITEDGNVNLKHLQAVRETLKGIVAKGDLVVVESSIYVGGTREMFGFLLTRGAYVANSPERVSPGTHEDSNTIPKLVAGLTPESTQMVTEIYRRVIKNVVPVSQCEVGEMAKLYENNFRAINIAYVNEVADYCSRVGINVDEVIAASSTKPFGFMPFHPGFGIGGFCISQNPIFMMHNENKSNFPTLNTAHVAMRDRPAKRAAEIVKQIKNNKKFEVNSPTFEDGPIVATDDEKILVVGVGFKSGQALTAFSPALELCDALRKENKTVDILDPIVHPMTFEQVTISLLEKYACVVVGCRQPGIDFDVIEQHKRNGGFVVTH